MKAITWVGPCSQPAQPLKDYLETGKTDRPPGANLQNLATRTTPFLIVSEDWDELIAAGHKFPQCFQIYVGSSTETLAKLQLSIRPINLYFHSVDLLHLDDFKDLIHRLETRLSPQRRPSSSYGPIPSMQNSLEVLKQLTEQRLFELRNFSHKEDERRKNFRSLIQLARCFSMSRDIEEVVQHFWNDIKSIEGIRGISFVLFDEQSRCHQIMTKSGKYHFEEVPGISAVQFDFIESLLPTKNAPDILSLDDSQTHALNFLTKQHFKHLHGCGLSSNSSDRHFYMLIETIEGWRKSNTFVEYLRERLPFVLLTLEKHILQEEIKSKAKLWATTFDDLQDPLAIIKQNRSIVRANRQFHVVDGNQCHKAWAQSNIICQHCPLTIAQSTTFEIQIRDQIYQSRLFPISGSDKDKNEAFVAHYVDVTTERLLYSRLIQSEKMSAVGQLAGDLSEALSVPLKKIVNVSESLLDLPHLNGQSRTDTEEIRKASLRSLRIIEDFENFSQGHLETNLVMAETVVEKTIPLVKALLHGHRFHLQLSEEKNLIKVSFSLIQQVIYNLLRNAHQAMKGHGELRISTEPNRRNERPGVVIAVLDSGPGVSPEMREKIFQPLVTSKSHNDGTGLGLNIVKQIVESHGGIVGYEPRPEGGSKFWFWLPLAEETLT